VDASLSYALPDISSISERLTTGGEFPRCETEYRPSVKRHYEKLRSSRNSLFAHLKRVGWRQGLPAILDDPLKRVYGDFGAHHPFRSPVLSWTLRWTEPEVTGSLRAMLDRGPATDRLERIKSFLVALGVKSLPDDASIEACEIYAEQDNIDLEFWFSSTNADSDIRVICIEAKLDHHLTYGQLKKYHAKRTGTQKLGNGRIVKFDGNASEFFVVGFDSSDMEYAAPGDFATWRFTSWDTVIRRFMWTTMK